MHAPLVAKQGRLGTRRGRRVGPGRAEPAPLINAWLTIICEDADSISSALFQHSTAPTPNSGPFLWREQMANTSRYIIWARRDAHSLFGAANNPVIRNGSLLSFNDEARARAECDRLNAKMGEPHVRYSIKRASLGRRNQAAA
jgi:hypothetical protein